MSRWSLVLILLVLVVTLISAEPTNCPRSGKVIGYTSIADMNADMKVEHDRIQAGGTPMSSYTYRLCPNHVFDASEEPLKPLLNNVNFVCGESGSRANNCVVLGGSEQVRIENSDVAGYPIKMLSFMGMTFAGFTANMAGTGTSINALADATTTATFMDVQFTVSVYFEPLILLSCQSEKKLTLSSFSRRTLTATMLFVKPPVSVPNPP